MFQKIQLNKSIAFEMIKEHSLNFYESIKKIDNDTVESINEILSKVFYHFFP